MQIIVKDLLSEMKEHTVLMKKFVSSPEAQHSLVTVSDLRCVILKPSPKLLPLDFRMS